MDTPFHYQPVLETGPDTTEYYRLDSPGVTTVDTPEGVFLRVSPETLSALAERAFDDVSHLLRASHLEKLRKILDDPGASDNDTFVAGELLRNAVIASQRIFPSCQDTGTALVLGKKGERVLTGADDAEALSRGIYEAFRSRNLRYSQLAPLSMFEEKNTGTNLPAQIDISACRGGAYEFLFIAKGGGSANKSFLFQKTKSLLTPSALEEFVRGAMASIGTAACPPYHLALVVGGFSAEYTMKVVKLASCGALDSLPTSGNAHGRAFRDVATEPLVERWARESGIGAQFGGKYFVHDVRVIRLPRHGASCPVGIGVSCSADRQIKARISADGVFLERLETDPARFLPPGGLVAAGAGTALDLTRPLSEVRAVLGGLSVGDRVRLSGPMIVARDSAHARLHQKLKTDGSLPDYFKELPVYYAGPAKTPAGLASGSFGPTTSERMDPYVPDFQAAGASLVMLGKGNRSPGVVESCRRHGGFYLGSVGGPAAVLGKECITAVEVIDFHDLGMEAVWKITVRDFPAFVVTDDKGNDLFARFRSDVVTIGK